jgi:hypothetical protein
MRVGEIICRSETFLQEPSFKLPFDRAFIRSSSHSSAGGGDFRQTVIVAPSTACTRRAKNKKVRNQTVFKAELPDEDARANMRADAFQNWTSTTFNCQVRKDRIADRTFRVRRRIPKINRKSVS